MSKNLKRILLASVGTIVFAGAGPFERKRSRGINAAITQLLLFAALLFITSVTTAAADMRGDQFVTVMDGNAEQRDPLRGFPRPGQRPYPTVTLLARAPERPCS